MFSNQLKDSEIFLSIIIPAYNEEKRIGRTLDATIDYFGNCGYNFELIVVDDGSEDETVNIVKSKLSTLNNAKLISYTPNGGKGSAVRHGILASKGQYVMFMDADLSTPIEEVERALHYLRNGYDIVIGSRGLPESEILSRQPFYREMATRIFKLFYEIIGFFFPMI